VHARSSYRSLAPLAFLLVTLAACGSVATARPVYTEVAAETLRSADAIPAPSGAVVLTVGGDIGKSNSGSTVRLDVATVERMGLVKYSVHDPWLDADHEFSGVLLSDMLDTIGAAPGSTRMHFVAIDDYEVEILIADVRKWPILLATRMDGQPMSIADKGPLRVVFPYDQFPEIDRLAYKDLWIWSLESLDVR
jgi:hypothetical protein